MAKRKRPSSESFSGGLRGSAKEQKRGKKKIKKASPPPSTESYSAGLRGSAKSQKRGKKIVKRAARQTSALEHKRAAKKWRTISLFEGRQKPKTNYSPRTYESRYGVDTKAREKAFIKEKTIAGRGRRARINLGGTDFGVKKTLRLANTPSAIVRDKEIKAKVRTIRTLEQQLDIAKKAAPTAKETLNTATVLTEGQLNKYKETAKKSSQIISTLEASIAQEKEALARLKKSKFVGRQTSSTKQLEKLPDLPRNAKKRKQLIERKEKFEAKEKRINRKLPKLAEKSKQQTEEAEKVGLSKTAVKEVAKLTEVTVRVVKNAISIAKARGDKKEEELFRASLSYLKNPKIKGNRGGETAPAMILSPIFQYLNETYGTRESGRVHPLVEEYSKQEEIAVSTVNAAEKKGIVWWKAFADPISGTATAIDLISARKLITAPVAFLSRRSGLTAGAKLGAAAVSSSIKSVRGSIGRSIKTARLKSSLGKEATEEAIKKGQFAVKNVKSPFAAAKGKKGFKAKVNAVADDAAKFDEAAVSNKNVSDDVVKENIKSQQSKATGAEKVKQGVKTSADDIDEAFKKLEDFKKYADDVIKKSPKASTKKNLAIKIKQLEDEAMQITAARLNSADKFAKGIVLPARTLAASSLKGAKIYTTAYKPYLIAAGGASTTALMTDLIFNEGDVGTKLLTRSYKDVRDLATSFPYSIQVLGTGIKDIVLEGDITIAEQLWNSVLQYDPVALTIQGILGDAGIIKEQDYYARAYESASQRPVSAALSILGTYSIAGRAAGGVTRGLGSVGRYTPMADSDAFKVQLGMIQDKIDATEGAKKLLYKTQKGLVRIGNYGTQSRAPLQIIGDQYTVPRRYSSNLVTARVQRYAEGKRPQAELDAQKYLIMKNDLDLLVPKFQLVERHLSGEMAKELVKIGNKLSKEVGEGAEQFAYNALTRIVKSPETARTDLSDELIRLGSEFWGLGIKIKDPIPEQTRSAMRVWQDMSDAERLQYTLFQDFTTESAPSMERFMGGRGEVMLPVTEVYEQIAEFDEAARASFPLLEDVTVWNYHFDTPDKDVLSGNVETIRDISPAYDDVPSSLERTGVQGVGYNRQAVSERALETRLLFEEADGNKRTINYIPTTLKSDNKDYGNPEGDAATSVASQLEEIAQDIIDTKRIYRKWEANYDTDSHLRLNDITELTDSPPERSATAEEIKWAEDILSQPRPELARTRVVIEKGSRIIDINYHNDIGESEIVIPRGTKFVRDDSGAEPTYRAITHDAEATRAAIANKGIEAERILLNINNTQKMFENVQYFENPKLWEILDEYKATVEPLADKMIELGLLDRAQAEMAPLIPYMVTKMGAKWNDDIGWYIPQKNTKTVEKFESDIEEQQKSIGERIRQQGMMSLIQNTSSRTEITLPRVFFEDTLDSDTFKGFGDNPLDSDEWKLVGNKIRANLTKEDIDELKSRAQYYIDMGTAELGQESLGLVSSARATLKALEKIEIEEPPVRDLPTDAEIARAIASEKYDLTEIFFGKGTVSAGPDATGVFKTFRNEYVNKIRNGQVTPYKTSEDAYQLFDFTSDTGNAFFDALFSLNRNEMNKEDNIQFVSEQQMEADLTNPLMNYLEEFLLKDLTDLDVFDRNLKFVVARLAPNGNTSNLEPSLKTAINQLEDLTDSYALTGSKSTESNFYNQALEILLRAATESTSVAKTKDIQTLAYLLLKQGPQDGSIYKYDTRIQRLEKELFSTNTPVDIRIYTDYKFDTISRTFGGKNGRLSIYDLTRLVYARQNRMALPVSFSMELDKLDVLPAGLIKKRGEAETIYVAPSSVGFKTVSRNLKEVNGEFGSGIALTPDFVKKHMKENGVKGTPTYAPSQLAAIPDSTPDEEVFTGMTGPYAHELPNLGKIIGSGQYESNFDRTLLAGPILAVRNISKARFYAEIAAKTGVRKADGGVWDSYESAKQDADKNADNYPWPMVPMAVRTQEYALGSFKEKDFKRANIKNVADKNPLGDLTKILENSLSTKKGQEYILIPKIVADRLNEHIEAEEKIGQFWRWFNREFKGSVLPFNPRWHVGNIVDMTIRLLAEGAGPRSLYRGRKIIKYLEQHNPELLVQIQAEIGGGHLMTASKAQVAGKLTEAVPAYRRRAMVGEFKQAAGRVENPKDLIDPNFVKAGKNIFDYVLTSPLRGYRRAQQGSFALGQFIEENYRYAAFGKHTTKALDELGANWARSMFWNKKVLEDLSLFLESPTNVNMLGKYTLKTLGNYTAMSPRYRRMVGSYLPFGLWARAAATFVLTLPVRHPIKSAFFAQVAKMTEEERKEYGLYLLKETKNVLPMFMQGSLVIDGEYIRTSNYTSFGPFYDPLAVADFIAPQFSTFLNIRAGRDFTDAEIIDKNGNPIGSSERVALAFSAALEMFFYPAALLHQMSVKGTPSSRSINPIFTKSPVLKKLFGRVLGGVTERDFYYDKYGRKAIVDKPEKNAGGIKQTFLNWGNPFRKVPYSFEGFSTQQKSPSSLYGKSKSEPRTSSLFGNK